MKLRALFSWHMDLGFTLIRDNCLFLLSLFFLLSALVARSLAEREASGKVIAIAMVDPLAEQSLAELPDQP